MPPRARASRAPETAPGCAAARSSAPPLSDHRSSRVVAGDTAELACQRMGGCISHANAAAISAQPALRLTARCPSAFSRRCEGYCGTRRRRCGDYPAQPGTTPRPGAPPPASAATGHRRCHASSRLMRALRQPSTWCLPTALRCACSAPPRRMQQRASAPLLRVCGETRALLRQSSPPRSWTDARSRHCCCCSCSCCSQSCARPLSLLVVTAGAAALLPPSSQRGAICSHALLSAAKPAPSHLLSRAASVHDRPPPRRHRNSCGRKGVHTAGAVPPRS